MSDEKTPEQEPAVSGPKIRAHELQGVSSGVLAQARAAGSLLRSPAKEIQPGACLDPKARADALRVLATSGVLVEARAELRTLLARAGAGPMSPVSSERLGQLSPALTTGVQATEQPAARGLKVQKLGTQVGLPAAGFGQGAVKTAKGVEQSPGGPESSETLPKHQQTPETEAPAPEVQKRLASPLDRIAAAFRELRETGVAENRESGPVKASPTSAVRDRGGDGQTR